MIVMISFHKKSLDEKNTCVFAYFLLSVEIKYFWNVKSWFAYLSLVLMTILRFFKEC